MGQVPTAIGAVLLALSAMISQAVGMPLQPLSTVVARTSDVAEVHLRRGFYTAGGFYYFNGYKGYGRFRPGYRYYHGHWFLAGAFAAGVAAGVVGAAISDPYPRRRARAWPPRMSHGAITTMFPIAPGTTPISPIGDRAGNAGRPTTDLQGA